MKRVLWLAFLLVFLFLALLLVILPAQAQVNVTLVPAPKVQWLDLNGDPLASGHVHAWISGTTTNQATYTDSTGGTPNSNPVVLDSAGRAEIWLEDALVYTLALHDSSNALVWSVDGVSAGDLETALVIGTTAVTFTSTPTFDSSTASYFSITLTGNVTSSTISNASDGRIIYFNICQDATGGRTFTWPASVLTAPTIGPGPSICTSASFIYDGTNWRELAAVSQGPATVLDGKGNRYSTIQGALDACPTAGCTIRPQAGTHSSSTAITISGDDIRIVGAGRATILEFTGATDGIVFDNSASGRTRISVEHLTIRTTNSGGLHAIELDGSSNSLNEIILRDILIGFSGSGRWTHGIFADQWLTSYVYALKIESSATVCIRLQNSSNALNFYGIECVGTSGAGTINRAIEINASSRDSFFGGTLQGNFEQSLIHLDGSTRGHFAGMHWENTDNSPSDGADIIVVGGSQATTFLDNDLGSFDIGSSGTSRGINVIGGQSDGLTLGSGAQQCLVMGVRGPVAGFTDNGSRNIFLSNGDTSGGILADKVGGRRQWLKDGTSTIPTQATIGANAVLTVENGSEFHALDSGGTDRIVWIPLSGSDETFFQYLATNSLIFRDTDNNTRLTITDAATTVANQLTASAATLLSPLEGSLSNIPRWIFKQVDHTDMTAAATADDFVLWTLPANTMIHDVVGTVVTAWEAAVGLSAAVCSVGTAAGGATDLALDDDFFAIATVYELHDATASGGKGSLLFDSTDKFAPFMLVASGDIEIQCDLTGDDHADTNAGQARIYILVSQPLGNTTTEAN